MMQRQLFIQHGVIGSAVFAGGALLADNRFIVDPSLQMVTKPAI